MFGRRRRPPAEDCAEATEALRRLGRRHDTDKVRKHGYEPCYARHLGAFRDDRFTLLEIGVKRGASLYMWRDFFVRAQIVGIDIEPAARACAGERIAVEIGDQGNAGFLREITSRYGPFRVVIDDGSHRMSDQRRSFEALWPDALEPGGYYVLEDLQTSNSEKHIDERPVTTERLGELAHLLCSGQCETLAAMHCYPRIAFLQRRPSTRGRDPDR